MIRMNCWSFWARYIFFVQMWYYITISRYYDITFEVKIWNDQNEEVNILSTMCVFVQMWYYITISRYHTWTFELIRMNTWSFWASNVCFCPNVIFFFTNFLREFNTFNVTFFRDAILTPEGAILTLLRCIRSSKSPPPQSAEQQSTRGRRSCSSRTSRVTGAADSRALKMDLMSCRIISLSGRGHRNYRITKKVRFATLQIQNARVLFSVQCLKEMERECFVQYPKEMDFLASGLECYLNNR